MANGDQLSGSVLAIEDGSVRMRTASGDVQTIEVRRVAAAIFNPLLTRRDDSRTAPQSAPPPDATLRAWTGLSDGSRLLAQRIVHDDKSLAVTTAGGIVWKAPAMDLVALQPLGGQAVYLSDLPAKYRYTPYLAWERGD